MENVSTDCNTLNFTSSNFSSCLGGGTKNWLLEANCRDNWPRWSCIFFNLCGLNSTVVWFIVLFPQVVKNFRRRSVHGLSILWALANFTASFVNLFFVFSVVEMPAYVKISAVYMPILELFLLIQFLVYDKNCAIIKKVVFSLICTVIWVIIALVSVFYGIADKLVWISIFFWSAQTLFQVFLNMQLRSTEGQSTVSVILAMIGKMTDYLSIYGLKMPIQYVTSIFFSSSVAYTNVIQVVWYWGIKLSDADHDETIKISLTPLRIAFLCYLIGAQVFYGAGIIWNLSTPFAAIAPIGLVALYTAGYLIISFQRRRRIRKRSRPSFDNSEEDKLNAIVA